MEYCVERPGRNKPVLLAVIDMSFPLAHCTKDVLLASLSVYLHGSQRMSLGSHCYSLQRCLCAWGQGPEGTSSVHQKWHTRHNSEGYLKYEPKSIPRFVLTQNEMKSMLI